MTERITSLAAPPVVGRWYLVPTVEYRWLYEGEARAWPVFLPKHEDKEHLKFEWDHYHVDPRFLTSSLWQKCISAGRYYGTEQRSDRSAFRFAQGVPLQRMDRRTGVSEPHGPIVWRKMRCARVEIPYVHGHQLTIQALRQHYAGRTCKRARSGWVCPHKHAPMGSIAPDAEGVITCPLHGLRVRAADGMVLDD